MLHVSFVLLLIVPARSVNLKGLDAAFPVNWKGDQYKEATCRVRESSNFPKFLDGYFLCQLSATYGRQSDEDGRKLTHMFDGLGAVASWHIARNGHVNISGAYYPATPFKIWDFYGRDFNKSTIAWPTGYSKWDSETWDTWNKIRPVPDLMSVGPKVDFWRIGTEVVAETENPFGNGLTFDVRSTSDFRRYPFNDVSDIYLGRSNITLINMPVHERMDKDGTIWGSVAGVDTNTLTFYQVVFTVTPKGLRTVEAVFRFGSVNTSQCRQTPVSKVLAGYMHSITSTDKYIVLPVTSAVLFNPCKPVPGQTGRLRNGTFSSRIQYEPSIPLRFLVFDKKSKKFVTTEPLQANIPLFVTHQFNAYEESPGIIVADMVGENSTDPYDKYLYADFVMKEMWPKKTQSLRFRLDLTNRAVTQSNLLPEQMAVEFPQVNHNYDGLPYKHGYVIVDPMRAGADILKIDMNDPSGKNNKRFGPGETFAVSEPYFVARPGSTVEDDGVLLVRGLHTEKKIGVLFVVDAQSMEEISRAEAPVVVPFGFHNRYYTNEELGLPATPTSSGTVFTANLILINIIIFSLISIAY